MYRKLYLDCTIYTQSEIHQGHACASAIVTRRAFWCRKLSTVCKETPPGRNARRSRIRAMRLTCRPPSRCRRRGTRAFLAGGCHPSWNLSPPGYRRRASRTARPVQFRSDDEKLRFKATRRVALLQRDRGGLSQRRTLRPGLYCTAPVLQQSSRKMFVSWHETQRAPAAGVGFPLPAVSGGMQQR